MNIYSHATGQSEAEGVSPIPRSKFAPNASPREPSVSDSGEENNFGPHDNSVEKLWKNK